jgi:hypothetical protein
VWEWAISIPGQLTDPVAFLQRIVADDLADLPLGLNKTRLQGYSGYVPLASHPRSPLKPPSGLPTPFSPLGNMWTLNSESRVVAVAGVEQGCVVELTEDAGPPGRP